MEDRTAKLARIGSDAAMLAAALYLKQEGHDPAKVDTSALCVHIRAALRVRIPEAMRDANEAMACGMAGAASATFMASMKLAGIDAGRAFLAA